jgi:predicted RNA binding protein YcfA (HicA-like mRNA interferase family)
LIADFRPDVERKLKENGCYFKRAGKGDHAFWFSPVSTRSFPVDHKILSRRTANAIMKQAGIDHKF